MDIFKQIAFAVLFIISGVANGSEFTYSITKENDKFEAMGLIYKNANASYQDKRYSTGLLRTR